MIDEEYEKLLGFATYCNNIHKYLIFGTTSLTPLNFEEEKQKFLTSSTYNPIYYYKSFDAKPFENALKELRVILKSLRIPRDLKLYLEDYLLDLKLLEKTKKNIGSDDFAYYARKLFKYHEINFHTTSLSHPDCLSQEPPSNTLLTAPEIAGVFEDILHNRYGLTQFEVFVDSGKCNIIWTGGKSIHIGRAIKRYEKNVRRLVVHEIESHALQFHNLSLYNNPLMRLTKYGESHLYSEGLAVFNEVKTKTITKKTYEEYWYRLKAVEMLDQSFREIYTYLSHYLPEKRAFLTTYRVKRGMKHTVKPGGFPKDASYFLGYKTISDYVHSGLHLDYLYLTKSPQLTSLLLRNNLLSPVKIKLPNFWTNSAKIRLMQPTVV